jgi:hypothetical protein
MRIGDIRPQEVEANEEEDPQAVAAQYPLTHSREESSTRLLHSSRAAVPLLRAASAAPLLQQQAPAAPSSPVQGLNLEPIFEEEEAEGPEDEQGGVEHPRLRQTIQRDHPVDNILGSIRKG